MQNSGSSFLAGFLVSGLTWSVVGSRVSSSSCGFVHAIGLKEFSSWSKGHLQFVF